MRTYVGEATIERSADDVWVYAADIDRHTEWMSASETRLVSGNGSQPGARGFARLEFGPVKRDVEFDVVEAIPGKRLLWRSVGDGDLAMEAELTLEPAGQTTTRVRYRGSYQLRGRLRLIAPIMALEGKAGVKREVDLLKARVEAQPKAAAVASTARG